MSDAVEVSRCIADETLFPAALDVDRDRVIPQSNFDALAGAGFFGVFAPPPLGGLGLGPELPLVVEAFAGGCLATTFVWIQHFGLLGTMLGHASDHLGERWLAPAVRGETRGGIALAGLLPGPAQLVADPAGDAWVLHGSSRWVTGWGIVDVVLVVARTRDDRRLISLLIDAADQPGLTVVPQRLTAVDASRTVQLDFDAVSVDDDRVVDDKPYDPAAYLGSDGLRLNGSLALGLASRCCQMIRPSALDDDVTAARDALDAATGDAIFDARAAASQLAVRAASALAVHTGSGASLAGSHADRLMREALFLLVFGSRPRIREALIDRLGAN